LRFSTRELALGFVAVLGSLPSSPDETFRLTDDADDSSPASRHKKKAFFCAVGRQLEPEIEEFQSAGLPQPVFI
jgi:hypothetical protein